MNTIRWIVWFIAVLGLGAMLCTTGCTTQHFSHRRYDLSGGPGPNGSRILEFKSKLDYRGQDGKMVHQEFESAVTNHPCEQKYADTVFPNFVGGMDAAVDANVYSGLHPQNDGNNHNYDHRPWR